MMKNKVVKNFGNVIWYVVVFVLIQVVVELAASAIWSVVKGQAFDAVSMGMAQGSYGDLLLTATAVSSVLTIALFAWRRWAPLTRQWLQTRPWASIAWTVVLALGIILPTQWVYEQMEIVMPKQMQAMFESIMRYPWGYLVIGILVPIAEEMVFRGAILRSLLQVFDRRMHWLPIVLSAMLFGLIHMNLAQGIYGFIVGLLLGWFYYRTGSIFLGLVAHWVNNSVAYVMFNLTPNQDGKLIDLFYGDAKVMYMALGFSACIALPALFQLAIRMKRE